jgi:hypothetical protein
LRSSGRSIDPGCEHSGSPSASLDATPEYHRSGQSPEPWSSLRQSGSPADRLPEQPSAVARSRGRTRESYGPRRPPFPGKDGSSPSRRPSRRSPTAGAMDSCSPLPSGRCAQRTFGGVLPPPGQGRSRASVGEADGNLRDPAWPGEHIGACSTRTRSDATAAAFDPSIRSEDPTARSAGRRGPQVTVAQAPPPPRDDRPKASASAAFRPQHPDRPKPAEPRARTTDGARGRVRSTRTYHRQRARPSSPSSEEVGPGGRARSRRPATPPMGFGAFRRNQRRESLRAGLPRRHLPLSGFLTPSAV